MFVGILPISMRYSNTLATHPGVELRCGLLDVHSGTPPALRAGQAECFGVRRDGTISWRRTVSGRSNRSITGRLATSIRARSASDSQFSRVSRCRSCSARVRRPGCPCPSRCGTFRGTPTSSRSRGRSAPRRSRASRRAVSAGRRLPHGRFGVHRRSSVGGAGRPRPAPRRLCGATRSDRSDRAHRLPIPDGT